MKWDCGALRAIPSQSLIYRTVTKRYSKYWTWPEEYQQEMATFVATPGVAVHWLIRNLHLEPCTGRKLIKRWPDAAARGIENAISATYDDARRYVERNIKGGALPPWAYLFAMADKKAGMSSKEFLSVWGQPRNRIIGDI